MTFLQIVSDLITEISKKHPSNRGLRSLDEQLQFSLKTISNVAKSYNIVTYKAAIEGGFARHLENIPKGFKKAGAVPCLFTLSTIAMSFSDLLRHVEDPEAYSEMESVVGAYPFNELVADLGRFATSPVPSQHFITAYIPTLLTGWISDLEDFVSERNPQVQSLYKALDELRDSAGSVQNQSHQMILAENSAMAVSQLVMLLSTFLMFVAELGKHVDITDFVSTLHNEGFILTPSEVRIGDLVVETKHIDPSEKVIRLF